MMIYSLCFGQEFRDLIVYLWSTMGRSRLWLDGASDKLILSVEPVTLTLWHSQRHLCCPHKTSFASLVSKWWHRWMEFLCSCSLRIAVAPCPEQGCWEGGRRGKAMICRIRTLGLSGSYCCLFTQHCCTVCSLWGLLYATEWGLKFSLERTHTPVVLPVVLLMKTHFWTTRPTKASFSVQGIMPTLSSYLGRDSLRSKKKKRQLSVFGSKFLNIT